MESSTNPRPADRRPTRHRPGRPTRLRCLGPAVEPPFDAVTSASVVAVTGDGRLVLADLRRGLDIPGGHVQHGETSAEQTVRREAWEETGIRLGGLVRVEIIESDYFGADDLTYMLIYAARVAKIAEWTPGHESAGRTLLSPEDFLRGFRGGRPDLMRHLVSAALVALGPATP